MVLLAMRAILLTFGVLCTLIPSQVSSMEPDFLIDFAKQNLTKQNLTTDDEVGSACADITDCHNCTSTYTCHWCSFDHECHARGSIHGCAWGTSCDAPPPKPKENSTCASHMTCSECASSSHFCHWCEHDNACHAVGSRYGCATGVDCYSNDRCRRTKPEMFHRFVVMDIPPVVVVLTIIIGALLVACMSCCLYCVFNVKGAYDDLATISMAASRPPSVIGGTLMGPTEQFYSTLETHPEEENEHDENDDSAEEVAPASSSGADEEAPDAADVTAEAPAPTGHEEQGQPQQQQQQEHQSQELESDPATLLAGGNDGPTTPLLPSAARSFNGIPGMEETPHMKALYGLCTCFYYLGILLVCFLVVSTLYLYPKVPVYNVCNDAVAWKKIIENLVALKLDASFEILVSISNPNHLTVKVDKGSGSFSFDGQPIGTYEIPAATAEGMAISDVMLIAKVTPDRYQALQLAEAYYRGNLVLNADFNAKLRAPALYDYTYELHIKDIDVYVNELGARDLCHCPSWDDARNHTASVAFLN